jgi:hypothetical protein
MLESDILRNQRKRLGVIRHRRKKESPVPGQGETEGDIDSPPFTPKKYELARPAWS